MMKFYVYAVCFICIVTGAIFLGAGIWGGARIYYPELTVRSRTWNKVATIESFKADPKKSKELDDLTDQEIAKRWQVEKDATIKEEKREGIRDIFQMVICLIIVGPLFGVHWRMAKRLRVAGGGG
jgi:hypothetical protein